MLNRLTFLCVAALLLQIAAFSPAQANESLLNVSYDPTRELTKR